jgi:hypothetical protein
VPVLPDQVGGEDGRTLTITLSEPGGRATLGSPAATELSIRDDDLGPPPPPQPFGLDPTYGTGGKASTTAFGGDRSSMALQPDGRVVMAGGTFTAFVLVRLLPDGQPDPDFGVGGQVVTDVGGQDNEAQNVVVLPDDGRIPVSGSSRNPGSSGVGIDTTPTSPATWPTGSPTRASGPAAR